MQTSANSEQPLWMPGEALKQQANITQYMQWLEHEKGLHFADREALWLWSVTHLEDFWASLWDYFHIQSSHPYSTVLVERKMPGAQWFPGAMLNYAEHVFRNASDERPALLFRSERQVMVEVSWQELQTKVGAIAHRLVHCGER